MTSISDHHQYLFLGKITNSLTPEEDRELTELFARDAGALKAYEELVGRLPAGQVAESFGHLDEPGFWKNISGEINDQKVLSHKRKIRKVSLAVVLVFLMAGSGWWLLPGRKEAAGPSIASRVHAVELRLADGSTVDLTAQKGKLHKDQLLLDNGNNALSYEAAGGSSTAGGSAVGLNSISVPATMDYKINLPDGSEVWLNSVSTLSFPTTFATDKREITIMGEAYCQIARHPNQPFIIHLRGSTVQVTGTEFNINTYDPAVVKVALVTGGANLVSGATSLKLNVGYQGVSGNGRIVQAPFQAERVLSWRQGIFYFDGAGLDELSPVLARWFGIRTQLDEPSLADKKFVGALYKHRSLDSFLDNLKAISHIGSYFDKQGVLHFTATSVQ